MSDDRNNPAVTAQTRAIRSAFYRDSYANNFRFRLSPVDFSITFASNADVPGAGILLQDEMGVSMSLPAAKILSIHLNKMIEAVENQIGAIRIPTASVPTEQMIRDLTRSIRETPMTER
jgi:uncharacterized protein DUF3467